MAENEQEKTEQATQKRLDDARRKGQIPRSRDLSAAAVTLAGGTALYMLSGQIGGALYGLMREGLTISREQALDATQMLPSLANLAADGVSMGVGNLLAIRADERAREADGLPELEAYPWKHGLATLIAFAGAGAIPLVPYVLPLPSPARLPWSIGMTFASLFLLGALRALITRDRWWRTGLETLMLGFVVALAAYGAGRLVAGLVPGS